MSAVGEAIESAGVWPWLLAIGLPLLLACALLNRAWRRRLTKLAPWSALPAVVLAVAAEPGAIAEAPWLLLGAHLGLDVMGRIFLGFTSLLWLLAGIYAKGYLGRDAAPHRFFAFYLAAMSGNFGLIIAQDVASFYLFFALMSFASYGLVVHTGDGEALRAGRIYMILVVVGEVLIFSAIVLAAHSALDLSFQGLGEDIAQGPHYPAVILLAYLGFGIKAGALPLHVWLPLAHPAAPTPASAVLSGAMIKAGLLGWLRFLALGEAGLPLAGAWLTAAGLAAAFYAVAVGLAQSNPKTVLAYSSVSQMGLMTVPVGLALAAPEVWPAAQTAILLYALHHAFAKGALFLGVGVAAHSAGNRWERGLIVAGLVFPCLALAGLPFTSGAVAKAALKSAVVGLDPVLWLYVLDLLLPWTAAGTTLLLGRFLLLVWPRAAQDSAGAARGLWPPWMLAIAAVALMPGLSYWYGYGDPIVTSLARNYLWSNFWPVGVGAVTAWGAWKWRRKWKIAAALEIPAGDLVVPAERLGRRLQQVRYRDWLLNAVPWPPARSGQRRRLPRRPTDERLVLRLEAWLGRWLMAGLLFVLLAATLFVLLTIA